MGTNDFCYIEHKEISKARDLAKIRGKELLMREYKETISVPKNKDLYHAIHPKSLQMDGLIHSNENP